MEWRPVPGFPNYEISDSGLVRTIAHTTTYTTRTGVTRTRRFPSQPVKTRVAKGFGEHVIVQLDAGEGMKSRRVHRLVLEAFVGPPPNSKSLGLHGDDDKLNNHLSNLRWGTYSDNGHDAVRNGKHALGSATECPRGHPFTEENTYIRKGGGRMCMECQRRRDRERYARRTVVAG